MKLVNSWMGEHRSSFSNLYNVIREKRGILLIPERLVRFEEEEDARFVEIPGDTPEAVFMIAANEVTAREYCNLHGLWKA